MRYMMMTALCPCATTIHTQTQRQPMAMAQPASSSSKRALCLSRQGAAGNECHGASWQSAHMHLAAIMHTHDALAILELPLLLNDPLTQASCLCTHHPNFGFCDLLKSKRIYN